MTLRLSVVSEHATRLGEQSSKVFGVHGGTIGRGPDNAWMLPDPERYLSGKHARIDYRSGSYVLVDTSSNGTYINGAQVPLGKYRDYVLKDGDYLRLGEYELLVSIDKSNDISPDESAIMAYDGKAPSSAVRKSTADDLGADLDLSQLLEPSDRLGQDSGVRARDAYGQSISPERTPPEAGASGGTPWHMMTRPLRVTSAPAPAPAAPVTSGAPFTSGAPSTPGVPPVSSPVSTGSMSGRGANPLLYDGDFDIGLATLCRGAGLDPRSISSEARNAALQLAGQLLREAVLGLMELNQSRNEFRNRFRMPSPTPDGPESPLSLSRGVDEAIVRLLNTTSTRAGAVEAIRDHFRELKAHQGALLAAMRAAFEDFLGRVEPKELEERFERATKRAMFGNKGKYWDLYTEMFGGLAQRPADGFPHVFIEAFAKAYEAKLRTLVPPRRAPFAERDAGDAPAAQGQN
jgi:type VI secretion system protein